MMWNKVEQSISSGDKSINLLAGGDINFSISANFPTALVDQRIDEELSIVQKSRFFSEFDRVDATLTLERRLRCELSGGTATVRSRALAWCARLLSRTTEIDKAEEDLRIAKSLGACPEIEIADAFVSSQKGDKIAAQNKLARINSPASRSAAFMIVAHHEGGEKALDWLEKAEIRATDMDAEGKYFLIAQQLELSRWEAARESLNSIDDQDLNNAPVLYHISAITHLLSTVPTEYRVLVLNQLPFETADFPLASDAAAMDARRKAQRQFADAANVARQLHCPRTALLDDEYALWLELIDPQTSEKAKQELGEKLSDPKSALRLVPLGLQFRIKLNLAEVEREIDLQIALHGGISQEAAVARFALAFTQKSPKDVASYIARHYDELSKYLDKKSMGFLQIEMLSRAGMPEKASERLALLLEQGLSEYEEARLQRIIAEAEGADPVELRKAQFRQTDSLSDLVTLVDELEARRNWEDLCEFGEILFGRTRSARDAERLAKALSNTQQSERLVEFLKGLADFREQSMNLQMVYCWSLFHEGALLDARTEMSRLRDEPDEPNYRALKVNLGIALGDWASLSAFVAAEYEARDKRNAQDLIGAAQLAHHVGSPNAKDLTFAAAAKGSDDAGVLAAAYFLATRAGWEDDEKVAQWLQKAAELSEDNGPIQKMTLKDLVAQKPEWDRRESEIWQMLSHGDIPMSLGGRALNRSLIDLMLFPALANVSERDPRKWGAISSYSGK